MKRILGAVSSALRGFVPKPSPPKVSNSVHRENVRKAMETLAPKGAMLPSENKALAIKLAAASTKGEDLLKKSPEEMFALANELYQVGLV